MKESLISCRRVKPWAKPRGPWPKRRGCCCCRVKAGLVQRMPRRQRPWPTSTTCRAWKNWVCVCCRRAAGGNCCGSRAAATAGIGRAPDQSLTRFLIPHIKVWDLEAGKETLTTGQKGRESYRKMVTGTAASSAVAESVIFGYRDLPRSEPSRTCNVSCGKA